MKQINSLRGTMSNLIEKFERGEERKNLEKVFLIVKKIYLFIKFKLSFKICLLFEQKSVFLLTMEKI